ncbi:hypothetical protein [Endozoicomonas sp. GU-1]|uniref:hypothetical protein n=1 Tax=Endozoicomonas sp. GU-1 TaxID=3009078 RepID=UPI0022B5992B|nr:hypothetical protein [Endozoicomonas sp. GU-1]WBA86342.1 hypothetical protein O3276_24600 [Endozoicomonas sp. GU-1]
MDRLYFTGQVNTTPDHFSYFQGAASSEPGTSGRAFSRDVEEAATSLYIMSKDGTTENHLQQPAIPFHNPFDDPRFEKRSIVIIDNLTRKDQVLDFSIRRKLQSSDPTYIYDMDLPQTASQCLLCVDNNLHQPAYNTDWAFVNNHFMPATPATIVPPALDRSLQSDTANAESRRVRTSTRERARYHNNPAYAESKRLRNNARERARYHNDPAYAARKREYSRMFRRERLQNNPAHAESIRVRNNARERERYQNDPVYARHKNERNKLRRRIRLQNDPAYAERLRELDRDRKRTRYQNDPAYAQRERERKREVQRKSRLRKRVKESTTRIATTMSPILQSARARESAKENAIGILPLNPVPWHHIPGTVKITIF